jgi:CMP-N-acetylneuraminic acid synthetase
MSKNQNKYLGNNANPELIEAVKSSIKKQQSLSENDRDVKGISEKEWQARLAALEQAWRDNSAPAESTE